MDRGKDEKKIRKKSKKKKKRVWRWEKWGWNGTNDSLNRIREEISVSGL
jgi:hypothetical protein